MTDKATIQKFMEKNAKNNGYHLCPDKDLLDSLIEGLTTNKKRNGYASCPCRIPSGIKNFDVDIICPCEYRDADVSEFGTCYCGLFINEELKNNPSRMGPIPERRPKEIQDAAIDAMRLKKSKTVSKHTPSASSAKVSSEISIWRCTVCGYLCARDLPPPVCPICKAKAERFEKFSIK